MGGGARGEEEELGNDPHAVSWISGCLDDVDAAERLVDDAQTQGVLDAVFFHTLTSGFAAPVRAVGDVVSYAVRPISRRKRRRTDDS